MQLKWKYSKQLSVIVLASVTYTLILSYYGLFMGSFIVKLSPCLCYVFHAHANITFVCRCAAAYVLLAEEEATTITEAERLFKKALSIGKNGF